MYGTLCKQPSLPWKRPLRALFLNRAKGHFACYVLLYSNQRKLLTEIVAGFGAVAQS